MSSITGEPNEKPAIKAGIYKDLGKFLAFNRKASELRNKILQQEDLTQTLSSDHILWSDSRTSNFSFARAEIWNFFLIIMLFFLLAESLLGLPMSNFLTKSKAMSFNLNSWQIQGDTSTWIFATCIVIASSYLAIRTW